MTWRLGAHRIGSGLRKRATSPSAGLALRMHAHDSQRPVAAVVITVSTSRASKGATPDDASGLLISELLTSHGHTVVARNLVADDPEAIGKLLDQHLADAAVEAILLTGGTGISARDCTSSVVRGRLDRELPGFGALVRMLSYEQVGAKAMFSTAVAGVSRGRPVFSLPGSPRACDLAMMRLILPELGHFVVEVQKEGPLPITTARPAPATGLAAAPDRNAAADTKKDSAPADAAPPPPEGVSAVAPALVTPPDEAEIGSGWRAALKSLSATLDTKDWGEIPAALERMRPVMDVLEAANARATVLLPGGRRYTAFGYPDLVRNQSKVLLVRETEALVEIVALHRWPRETGLCGDGDEGILPSADLDPGPVTEARTGGRYAGSGRLFALDGQGVYIQEERRVALWDGKRLAPGVPPTSALGTLVLGWSQR